MKKSRRTFLKTTAGVAAVGAAAGYKDMLGAVTGITHPGERAANTIYGNAKPVAVSVDASGVLTANPDFIQANTLCIGCTTQCGVRVKIDKSTGKVVRVTGNPYNVLSTDPWLDYNASIRESLRWTSNYEQSGLAHRSVVCARGNVVFDKIDDAFRVLTPLKRAGKRGEDKWVPISPDQLLKEIVEGGDLFGEGHVDGLAAIHDNKNLIDLENPEYGPRSNQLAVIATTHEGRLDFLTHRFVTVFGTRNLAGHTGMCGLSMRAGNAALLGDFKGYPHLKPDFEECEFLLNIGTAPGQAGNPFKRQGQLLARARTEGKLHYVTVTPALTNSDALAAGKRSRWVPIIPGGDLALVMGMMRWIIENRRYNEGYLRIPDQKAMAAANEPSHSNATHLVIVDDNRPDAGRFLVDPESKEPLVIDTLDSALKPASQVAQGELFVDATVAVGKEQVAVKSAFTLLSEAVMAQDLNTYAEESGVSREEIARLAKEFTSHGRRVAVDTHGGSMQTTGFYAAYAILSLGALVGCLNYRGGMSPSGGGYEVYKGPRSDLYAVPGKPKPAGIRVDRARTPYERTSEYARKKAAGKPYPAGDQWYPLANALENEMVSAAVNRYPYPVKALITFNANFIYGQPGAERALGEDLKEPGKSIPLFIAIDPFINETSRLADYIVPDSVLYETWGITSPWGATDTKANALRFPVVEPRQDRFANGEPICMDSFVIELGKRLKLPGFGPGAIIQHDGTPQALDRPEDFYLRAFENIALDGEPVPDADDDDIVLAGLDGFRKRLKRVSPEHWRKIAYVMARGGRYESKARKYNGDFLAHGYRKPLQIYNETLGTSRNALTGERYSGVPVYGPQRFCTGQRLRDRYGKNQYPLHAFSYKSNVVATPDTASHLLHELRYSTYIDLNAATAEALSIRHGDRIRVISPAGEVEGLCRVRQGIHPEAVGVEHGRGREGEGAETVTIGDKVLKGLIARRTGVNINKLGLSDPTRPGVNTLADFVVGSVARQAVPVRVEKL